MSTSGGAVVFQAGGRRILLVALATPVVLVALLGDAAFFLSIYRDLMPVDGWWPGLPIDFSNTWFAAWTYWHGDLPTLFDQYEYNLARRQFFPLSQAAIWSYPLHFLVLVLPLGLVSFPVAAVLWTLGNLALLFWFVRRNYRLNAIGWALLVLSGSLLCTVFFGQVAILGLVLLVGGLRILPNRPVWAGIAFGLLTLKPQFGLLLPLFLLLDRRWQAIAAACATVAVLVGLSVALFGAESWLSFIRDTIPAQRDVMLERRSLWSFQPTWYAGARAMLWSRDAAFMLQAVQSLLVCGVLVFWQRVGVTYTERARMLPVLTFAALPYALAADLLVIAPLLAIRLSEEADPVPVKIALLALLLGAPAFIVVNVLTGWPLFPALYSAVTLMMVVEVTRNALAGRVDARIPGGAASSTALAT